MRYSILTPTICRRTLKRLADSITSQTNRSWEHLIMVDKPEGTLTAEEGQILASVEHPNRKVWYCTESHKNFGNACRRDLFEKAEGEYILQIDDDDFLADERVFETLEKVTETWAIFPTFSNGTKCHHDDPGVGRTGSAMFTYRRDTGCRFKDIKTYAADGLLVEELKSKYPFQNLGSERPLIVYPQANGGRTQAEIDAGVPVTAPASVNFVWERKNTALKYAADSCTVDWFDQFRAKVLEE